MLMGLGSAVFHPEGSRVAFMAAGNRRGLAQSIYQVGGNTGQALAPLITALILSPIRTKRCPMVFTSCFSSCTVTDLYSQVVFATVSLF